MLDWDLRSKSGFHEGMGGALGWFYSYQGRKDRRSHYFLNHDSCFVEIYSIPTPNTYDYGVCGAGLPFIRNIPIKRALYLQQLMLQHDG